MAKIHVVVIVCHSNGRDPRILHLLPIKQAVYTQKGAGTWHKGKVPWLVAPSMDWHVHKKAKNVSILAKNANSKMLTFLCAVCMFSLCAHRSCLCVRSIASSHNSGEKSGLKRWTQSPEHCVLTTQHALQWEFVQHEWVFHSKSHISDVWHKHWATVWGLCVDIEWTMVFELNIYSSILHRVVKINLACVSVSELSFLFHL